MKKVVFLYTELADYFLRCLESCGSDVQFLVVHWPINKEAPFQLRSGANTQLIGKNEYKKEELYKTISLFNPDLIVCSGWIDKSYIQIIKWFKSKNVKTAISLDNHWTASFKQYLASIISRFTILNYFDKAWVPGAIQQQYAVKLGFKISEIELGFYCADTTRFTKIYNERQKIQYSSDKNVLLYVARYVKHKGIFDLWNAFLEFKKTDTKHWELWCIGTGEEWENRIEHPAIRHFGFKQPDELQDYILAASAYILPSHFEPWGVSVHEMALSGLPLLLSNKVGSAEKFLANGMNGYQFDAGDDKHIFNALKSLSADTSDGIERMAKESHRLGGLINHQSWKQSLMRLLA
jgi:glycosyltransferase involved in cell wall biosynthesis